MTDWKSLCAELVHDLEDWHIAFGHDAVPASANETFDRIQKAKSVLNTDKVQRRLPLQQS